MTHDAERMDALIADGLLPSQFTHGQVIGGPGDVLAQVEAELSTCVSNNGRDSDRC